MRIGAIIQDRFEILAAGKAGGMGQIFRARELGSGREVAVKVLHKAQSRAAERFRDEAVALADIQHPGVVRYIDHGLTGDGDLYLAMEWLEGQDLSQYLRAWPHEDFLQRAAQLGDHVDGRISNELSQTIVAPPPAFEESSEMHASTIPELHAAVGWLGNTTDETQSILAPEHSVVVRRYRPLPVSQVLILAQRLSSAVAELHRRGIVHRDIKPGNIFLPGGYIEQLKLLDLGMIRRTAIGRQRTATGVLLGTPHYMAPEQVRAEGTITTSTDVWAIGCVMYVCTTGALPFEGEDLAGILARIVLADPPPIYDLEPLLPPTLGDIIMHCMVKDPARRPADAGSLAEELMDITSESLIYVGTTTTQGKHKWKAPALTADESRVTCMLLAMRSSVSPGQLGGMGLARGSEPPPVSFHDKAVTDWRATWEVAAPGDVDDTVLAEVVSSMGGILEHLANGTLLVSMHRATGDGAVSPVAQAVRAAQTSLALRRALPSLRMVIATGRRESGGPFAHAVNEAARALAGLAPGAIWMDASTAALLKSRFSIYRDANGYFLQGAPLSEVGRSLLGRASPHVGREGELSQVICAFQDCVDRQKVRALMVTAEPGMGKSRLQRELETSIRHMNMDVTILHCRGDVVGAGSSFLLLSQIIRTVAGSVESDSNDMQCRKLMERVRATVSADGKNDCDEIATFLGEIAGIHFPAHTREDLDAARSDPMIMWQRTRHAWTRWLDQECQRRPVLLFIDDVHWGDLPSIQHIDSALTTLSTSPLMLVALARPEVHTVFPGLWSNHGLESIGLSPLSYRASVDLVHAGLGAWAPKPLVDNLVERAGGNAFYLEELVRSVAQGASETLPDTVLGMVHARLDGLAPEAKRVLRAASIFGEIFWAGGVSALIGSSGVFRVREWLEDLVAREIVSEHGQSRLRGEVEYQFRHALVREAAYAMLTHEDRVLGHGLAGGWLEQNGERDCRILAEHFLRGFEPVRAVPHVVSAVAQALEANDFVAVQDLAERGILAGASGDMLGRLRAHQAVTSYWQSRYVDGRRHGLAALHHLDEGSVAWFTAMGCAIVSTARMGNTSWAADLLDTAMDIYCDPDAVSAQIGCLCRGAFQLVLGGHSALVDQILARIETIATSTVDGSPIDAGAQGQICDLRAIRAGYVGDIIVAREQFARAAAAYQRAGDMPNALMVEINLGWTKFELGDLSGATERCEEMLMHCTRQGAPQATLFARVQLARLYLRYPDKRGQAMEMIDECIVELSRSSNRRVEGFACLQRADLAYRLGDIDTSFDNAQSAVKLLEETPGFQSVALAMLARAELSRNQIDAATAHADKAMTIHRLLGGLLHDSDLPPLVLAQCLEASGDDLGARAVVVEAALRIERYASGFDNDVDARRYMNKEYTIEIFHAASRLASWSAKAT